MRILILNWKDLRHPEVGGAEVIAFEFARRLHRAGHDVTFFCRAFDGAAPEERIDGVRVVRRGGLLSTYLHAAGFHRSLDPKPELVLDMVNTICWQAPLYARRRTVAYVNQLAREVFFYHLPRPLSRVAYALERFQYLTYRQTPFLCYSNGTRGDLVGVGIPRDRIRLFPLGVDHDRYVPGEQKSEVPLFVFVARLVPMKRADLCVAAMPHVLRRHPNARLAIVGYGPEERALERQIHHLGLERSVSLVNRDALYFEKTPGDRKVELMQRAWAHVLPSVKEGWGMVVTEAAACGTPSIVTDVTGLRDSVRDGETGIVISSDPTPMELGDAMLRVIEDADLRDRLSRGAVEWAARFDWDTSFSVFYEQLLAAGDRPSPTREPAAAKRARESPGRTP